MKTNPNDSAFSLHEIKEYYNGNPTLIINHRGLTKREYFAAKAMQGILANELPVMGADGNLTNQPEDIAAHSIRYADALITELNK